MIRCMKPVVLPVNSRVWIFLVIGYLSVEWIGGVIVGVWDLCRFTEQVHKTAMLCCWKGNRRLYGNRQREDRIVTTD